MKMTTPTARLRFNPNKIKELRGDLSLDAFAYLISSPAKIFVRQQVHQWENGAYRPSLEALAQIAQATETPMEDFFIPDGNHEPT